MTLTPEEIKWGRFGSLYLLGSKDKDKVASFPLDRDCVSMGRDSTCDIRVYYDWVSRVHCKIQYNYDQQKSFMIPIGKAGVPLNNILVYPHRNPEGFSLNDGDEIGLGKKLFRFLYAPGPRPTRGMLFLSPSLNRRGFRLSLVPAVDVIPADPNRDQTASYPSMPPESQSAKPMTALRSPTKPSSAISFFMPKTPKTPGKASSSTLFGRAQQPESLTFQVCQDAGDLIALEEVDEEEEPDESMDGGRERIVERIRTHVSTDLACVQSFNSKGYSTPQPASSRILTTAPRTVVTDTGRHLSVEAQKMAISNGSAATPQRSSVKLLNLPLAKASQSQPGVIRSFSTPTVELKIVPSYESVMKHAPSTPSRLKQVTTFSEESPETPPRKPLPSPSKRTRTTPRSAKARPIYLAMRNSHEKAARAALPSFSLSPIASGPSSPEGANVFPVALLPGPNDVFSEYADEPQGDQDIQEEVEVATSLTPPQQRPQSILVTPGPNQTYLFRGPVGPTGMEIYDDDGNATGELADDYLPVDPMDVDEEGWQDRLVSVGYVAADAFIAPRAFNDHDVPIDPALIALSAIPTVPSEVPMSGPIDAVEPGVHAFIYPLQDAVTGAPILEHTNYLMPQFTAAEVVPDITPSNPENSRAEEILEQLEASTYAKLGRPKRAPIKVPKPSFTADNMPKPSVYTAAGQPPSIIPQPVGYQMLSNQEIIEGLIHQAPRELPSPPTPVSRRSSVGLAPQIQLKEAFQGSSTSTTGSPNVARQEDISDGSEVSLHNLRDKVDAMRRLSDLRDPALIPENAEENEDILHIGLPEVSIAVPSPSLEMTPMKSSLDPVVFETILGGEASAPESQDIHMATASDIPYDDVQAAVSARRFTSNSATVATSDGMLPSEEAISSNISLIPLPSLGPTFSAPRVVGNEVATPPRPADHIVSLDVSIARGQSVEHARGPEMMPAAVSTMSATEPKLGLTTETGMVVGRIEPTLETGFPEAAAILPTGTESEIPDQQAASAQPADNAVPAKATRTTRTRKPIASVAPVARRSTRKTADSAAVPLATELPQKRGRSTRKAVEILSAGEGHAAEQAQQEAAATSIAEPSVKPPSQDLISPLVPTDGAVTEHAPIADVPRLDAEAGELVEPDAAQEPAPQNKRRGRSTKTTAVVAHSSEPPQKAVEPVARRGKRKVDEASHDEEARLPPAKASRTTTGRRTKGADVVHSDDAATVRADPPSQSSATAVSEDIQMEDVRPLKALRRGRGKAATATEIDVPVDKASGPSRRTRGKAVLPEVVEEVEPIAETAVPSQNAEELRGNTRADPNGSVDELEPSRTIKPLRKGRSALVQPADVTEAPAQKSAVVTALRSTRKGKQTMEPKVPEGPASIATKRGGEVPPPAELPAPIRSTRGKRARPADDDDTDPLDLMPAEVPTARQPVEVVEAVIERGDNQPSPPKRRRTTRSAKQGPSTAIEIPTYEETTTGARGRHTSTSRSKVVDVAEDEVKENSPAPIKISATRTRASSRATTTSKTAPAHAVVARTTRSRARK